MRIALLSLCLVVGLTLSSCSEMATGEPMDAAPADMATDAAPADLAPHGPPAFYLELVDKSDPSGKVIAVCPEGSRVIGGGCDCDSDEQILHRARILLGSNGFECGCFDGAVTKRGATAQAACARP